MRAAWLSLVVATYFASCSGFSLTDTLTANPELVDIHRKNAHLPCVCTNGSLDCSERGKSSLETDDLCPGVIKNANAYDNDFVKFPIEFADAVFVNMSFNRLKKLPEFSEVNPLLKVLDLTRNSIFNSSYELRSFRALETLIVSENYELGSLMFLPQPCALRHLKAANIHLWSLDGPDLWSLDGPLLQCTMLETLDLSQNSLTALPEDTFWNLRKLRSLNLAGNLLETLPDGFFAPLFELRELSLQYCGIHTLSHDTFYTLSELEVLNLRGNLFKTLPSGIFSSMTVLSSLDFTNIPFETYPDALKNISSLEKLSLAIGSLTELPNNAFALQPQLKEINLLYNNILYLPNGIFSGLSSLQTVILTKNPMQSLRQDLFSETPNIKTVWLPCMELNIVNLFAIQNVSNILIGPCGKIKLSSAVFSVAPKTELLMINENIITRMSEDAFVDLPLLHTLDLNDNGLSSLPLTVFSPLPHLRRLHLFSNRLTEIPKGLFYGLSNLTSLSLSKNHLSKLEENAFSDLISLERLDLSINMLKSIPPNLFKDLPFLKEVSLENNLLSTLPAYNPSWKSVRAVSFSYNNISTLDPSALRSWLEVGRSDRQLNVRLREDQGNGPSPKALAWLLREPHISLGSCGFRRCNCGLVRRGGVLIELAAVIRCDKYRGPLEDWLTEIVRADRAYSPFN